ncbi:MAG: heat-inducible transcription repressor HrcA [Elusimicrobia bacterium CG1_02_63_36]|nr:MAG: heat-inducible transcription repressor HrcA [Elusimicrobia bacterium CG1_02_63_36]PIP82050.1 MAG: heat-inducible transcription repressor HrcA [Elusimicrobia bacterium CG22_combo_CG10-13_8_21_14_all_63_91]PJA16694.1 MAG: heat-inducible transcription repressor HrcA [Elusimicrobia bacterium CG_4_10_14_0_2_um_filter_63_34]PJB25326.1 MAG: heat-inducible transcription repressor HrcA [Elusimicrobia bacterium CG_4_9_14_3_um_filter_62_55]
MRQLDPTVAADRKHRVLQWVVHHFIETSRPIASSTIAEEGGLDLSSATLRNILKELEDEGYLQQPHTSAGRIPTDRGYRVYVDYLHDVQRLASNEKARIEKQYGNRLAELDRLLLQTSKVLAHLSHKTGLVLSPDFDCETLKRLELIPVGYQQVLAIVVTQNGQVRHWPIKLSFDPSAERLNVLNRFLNDNAFGRSISEVRRALASQIEITERELRELHQLANQLLEELDLADAPEKLFLDGTVSLVDGGAELGDLADIQSLMRVMEERKALASLLQDEVRFAVDSIGPEQKAVQVRIGEENAMPELRNLSLVTTVYRVGGRPVGALGVLGGKRMEYSRMMSLVDYVGRVVSRTLESWDDNERS